MTYPEFIDELRRLVDQAGTLLSGSTTHETREFRDWRHDAENTVSMAFGQGWPLPAGFNSWQRLYRVNGLGDAREQKQAFDQDLADSVGELRFLITNFEKYGEPAAQSNPPEPVPTVPVPLAVPEGVTLKWILKNVPATIWLVCVGVLVTVFLFGVGIAQYEPIRKFLAALLTEQ
jgi:hypothetical protein